MPKTLQRSNFPSRSITVKKRSKITLTPSIEDSTDPFNRRHQPTRAVKSSLKTDEVKEAAMSRPSLEHTRSTDSVRRARSTSVSTGTGRLTKTGRPSRATKGLPVHVCHLCGKVYTRAEHLRRHQLNHGIPKRACPIPGCRKQFYREDLLSRHIDDHRDAIIQPYQSLPSVSEQSSPRMNNTNFNSLQAPIPVRHRTVSAPECRFPQNSQQVYDHSLLHTPASYPPMDMPTHYTWGAASAPAMLSNSSSPSLDVQSLNLNSMQHTNSRGPFDLPFSSLDSIPRSNAEFNDYSFVSSGPYQSSFSVGPLDSTLDPQLVNMGVGSGHPMLSMDYLRSWAMDGAHGDYDL